MKSTLLAALVLLMGAALTLSSFPVVTGRQIGLLVVESAPDPAATGMPRSAHQSPDCLHISGEELPASSNGTGRANRHDHEEREEDGHPPVSAVHAAFPSGTSRYAEPLLRYMQHPSSILRYG